nr:hypothetical protein Iba_chr13cCG11080 [Ipomoea batatas]
MARSYASSNSQRENSDYGEVSASTPQASVFASGVAPWHSGSEIRPSFGICIGNPPIHRSPVTGGGDDGVAMAKRQVVDALAVLSAPRGWFLAMETSLPFGLRIIEIESS